MENYVVIDGERFDFVKAKEGMVGCYKCALKEWCELDDTPCSAFNKNELHYAKGRFVKHEDK